MVFRNQNTDQKQTSEKGRQKYNYSQGQQQAHTPKIYTQIMTDINRKHVLKRNNSEFTAVF